jgi:hypothetical protein
LCHRSSEPLHDEQQALEITAISRAALHLAAPFAANIEAMALGAAAIRCHDAEDLTLMHERGAVLSHPLRQFILTTGARLSRHWRTDHCIAVPTLEKGEIQYSQKEGMNALLYWYGVLQNTAAFAAFFANRTALYRAPRYSWRR